MNLDALKVFATDYYPLLKGKLRGSLEVLVAGSNPAHKVKDLCTEMGWVLHPDVADEDLTQLYRTATFSVLPYSYTTGAKLKLLSSLAHGVPYLATEVLRDQADEAPYPCLVSDSAEEWLYRIEETRNRGMTEDDRFAQVAVAKRSSWPVVTDRMFRLLEST